MIQSDNMGGFISAAFILQEEISLFIPFANKCNILLGPGKMWKPLQTQYQGISVTITPTGSDPGTTYNIKGTIIIKKQSEYLDILRNKHTLIIRCQTPDKLYHVIGTDEYPLLSELKPLTPNKPSGFSGYELSFEGTQLIEPPVLVI